jgi:cation transport ATPase
MYDEDPRVTPAETNLSAQDPGLLISPIWASAAMSFSSVSVISNSLRLRTLRL